MKDQIHNELVVPFTMIPNDIFNDPNLSLKQKGLLCYLISLPKGWIVYKTELENHFTDGRESISNALEDLVKMEFVSKIENPKQKGKFSGFTYTVLPLRVNRYGSTAADNPLLVNTNSNNTNRVNLYIKAESEKDSAEGDKKESIVKAKKKKGEVRILNFSPEESKEVYGSVKQFFLDLYLREYHTEYYFEPLNGAKIHSIIRKVIFKMKEKQQREDFTKQEVIDTTNYFVSTAYLLADNFLKSNFNLSNIDSKFNDSYTKISNRHNPAATINGSKPVSKFRTTA